MKRRFRYCVPAVVATALIASGCGSQSAGSGSAAKGTSSKPYRVVFIPGVTGNPFFSTIACGAQSVAKKLNVDFSVQGPSAFSVAAQAPVLQAVTASHPDAIMITNPDPKGLIAPLLRAQSAGIKIVNMDGDLADKSIGVTNIMTDNYRGGEAAGEAMAKAVHGAGPVLVIDNAPGYPVAEQRRAGFLAAIKKYPKIKLLPVQYSNNQTAAAASIVSSTAAAHPDLAGVYTLQTNNTEGAASGVRAAQRVGKIKIVGWDSSPPIVAALENGTITANILQYPYGQGIHGLESAVKAIKGEPVPREQTESFTVATPQNVHTPKVQQYIYKTTCS